MSVSFVEKLVQAGQTLSGKAFRALAGTDATGKARPLRSSFDGSLLVAPGDAAADAFGRLRSSSARELFSSKQLFAKDELFYVEELAGGATSVFVGNQAAVRLGVSGALDKATRQTRYYFPYVPGQSQLILATGILAENNDPEVTSRIGYFDDRNGIYFSANNGQLAVVRREYTQGSVNEETVPRANWSLDSLDGSGPSGVTLDATKTNIWIIDLAWLGVGAVRLGVQIGGRVIYCHEFQNENKFDTVYMSTPTLPVRYEIEAVGAPTGGPITMTHICSAVYSEGTGEALGLVASENMGTTVSPALTAGAPTPICSLRAQSGRERITLTPLSVSLRVAPLEDFLVDVYVGGTTTGGAFTPVPNTSAEFNPGATALTGGTKINSQYVSGFGSFGSDLTLQLQSTLSLGASVDGTTRDEITLVVTAFTGTPTVAAGFTWKELT